MTKYFSETPNPPYYIVAFSSRRTEGDNGYAEMAKAMEELAFQKPGALVLKVPVALMVLALPIRSGKMKRA